MRKINLLLILILSCWSTLGRAEEPAKQDHSELDAEEIERILEQIKAKEKRDIAFEALRQKIATEIESLPDHRWAGHYFSGTCLRTAECMDIAPGSGFAFKYQGDFGPADAASGTVAENDGKLNLSFSLKPRHEHQGLSKTLVPIAWGKRTYLIPAERILAFCNEVNEGAEPRWRIYGRFLLRQGDEKKTATGFPDVPEEFKPYLLKKPIETKILAVGKPVTTSWKITIPVTVQHGRKAGLLPGMELKIIEPCNNGEAITLEKVEEDRSEGVLIRYNVTDTSCPKIGSKLSTQNPIWAELHRRDQERLLERKK